MKLYLLRYSGTRPRVNLEAVGSSLQRPAPHRGSYRRAGGLPLQWTERELMYRIRLTTSGRLVANNRWVDAVEVREGKSGETWEFLSAAGWVVLRLPKALVESYEVIEDRRKVSPFARKPHPSSLEPVPDSPRLFSIAQIGRLFPKNSKVLGRPLARKPPLP